MSTELHGTGTHRIVLMTGGFATGSTVTAYIWSPALAKSGLQTFTEVAAEGLYYLNYNFTALGAYFGKFYEDGAAVTTGVFRVVSLTAAAGGFRGCGPFNC